LADEFYLLRGVDQQSRTGLIYYSQSRVLTVKRSDDFHLIVKVWHKSSPVLSAGPGEVVAVSAGVWSYWGSTLCKMYGYHSINWASSFDRS